MYEYLLKIHANCYKTFLVFRMRLLYFIRNDGLYFVIARRYDAAICYLERACFISFAMTPFTSSLRAATPRPPPPHPPPPSSPPPCPPSLPPSPPPPPPPPHTS